MALIIGDWLGWIIGGIIVLVIGIFLERHVGPSIIKTIGYALVIIGVILVIVGIILLAFL